MSEHAMFEVGDMIVDGNTVAELIYFNLENDVARYRTADKNVHTVHAQVLQRRARLLSPELHEESADSVKEETQTPELVEDRLAKARAAKARKRANAEGVTAEDEQPAAA